MSRGTLHGQILFTIVAILVSSWVSGATLYGVQSPGDPGQLMSIDTATGAPSVIGPISSVIDGIAFAPDGTLYAADNSAYQLVTLNPATGSVASVIGSYGFSNSVEGLAVRPSDDVLFGIDNNGPSLITLDTTTGAATHVGLFGVGMTMTGLAFNLDGSVLYSINHTDGCLFTVNQSTGAATSVGCGGAGPTGGPLGMARDPVSGTLYVAEWWGSNGTSVLAIVSDVNGSRTTVGPITGFDQIEGLSFNEEVPVELMNLSVE
jgi:hypothetical protein